MQQPEPRRAPTVTVEQRVARLHQHAVRLVIPCLVIIAAAGILGFASRELREHGPWLWWGAGATGAAILLGLVPIIVWLSIRYTITNTRVKTRRNLRGNTVHELAHRQVSHITMRRNWWQSMLGSGTIVLESADAARLILRDVPNAVTVTQALRELAGVHEQ